MVVGLIVAVNNSDTTYGMSILKRWEHGNYSEIESKRGLPGGYLKNRRMVKRRNEIAKFNCEMDDSVKFSF